VISNLIRNHRHLPTTRLIAKSFDESKKGSQRAGLCLGGHPKPATDGRLKTGH
jgi:hypothetical protein